MPENDRGLAETLEQLVLALRERGDDATARQVEEAAATIRRLIDDNIKLDVKREQAERELLRAEEERDALKAASLLSGVVPAHLAAHPGAERVRLPTDREGVTKRFEIFATPRALDCPRCGYGWEESRNIKCYFIVNCYPDGRPGEVFIIADRAGSTARGALDAVALHMSVGLQYGIPLSVFLDKMRGMRFGVGGATKDPKYPRVSSVLDLLARWMGDKWGLATA